MKNIRYTVFTLAVLAGLSWAVFGRAGEGQGDKTTAAKPAGGEPPNMEEMMKKAAAYATPGAGHKALEALVGEWDVDTRFWMGGPDAPPSTSRGISKVQWILGGRYLREEASGEMMGQKFEGVGITGYDNFRQKYVSFWIDNMGTGIATSEGTAEEGGKTLTFLGKMDEPMTGEKDKPTKYIVHILGPDKHTFEMHDLARGEKSKVMEMTYTRKQ